jgi:hypothetical protein
MHSSRFLSIQSHDRLPPKSQISEMTRDDLGVLNPSRDAGLVFAGLIENQSMGPRICDTLLGDGQVGVAVILNHGLCSPPTHMSLGQY